MAGKNANPKIQPLLAALLAHHRRTLPAEKTLRVHVVIQVQSKAAAMAVCRAIENNGGEVIAARQTELEANIMANSIEDVANLAFVYSIRLARIQSVNG